MSRILVLNGPNLNLLGKREPEIYGSKTLDDVMGQLIAKGSDRNIEISDFQSNSEAEMVDRVHQAATDQVDFIIINPGALTHTSIALRDALLGVAIPFIEVHISNVFSREAFRHKSFLSDVAVGCVIGLGTKGYELALTSAIDYLGEQ